MANPTTNYSWPMPLTTDLVTGLPAQFAAFGQPVDTSLKALNPATTLGDLQYRSATSNTNTRLGIGSTSQVLTVAAGVPSWATASSGGFTLIATATPSSATGIQFASIPATYKHLVISWSGETTGGTNPYFGLRCNNDATATLHPWAAAAFIAGTASTIYSATIGNIIGDSYQSAPVPKTSAYFKNGVIWIYDYSTTGSKTIKYSANGNTVNPTLVEGVGSYEGTSAISQLDFIRNSTQTITGTFRLYGAS